MSKKSTGLAMRIVAGVAALMILGLAFIPLLSTI